MSLSQIELVPRTKTADGQTFADLKLFHNISSAQTEFQVFGTTDTRKLAPGLEIMIRAEVMTVIHAKVTVRTMVVDPVLDGNFLQVKRGQRTTTAAAHYAQAQIFAALPGFRAGDGVPFKVQRKGATLAYIRQSTALPGAANRLVTSLAFNYPVNAMDMLSITGLRGYSLRSSKLGKACSTRASSFQERCPTSTQSVAIGTVSVTRDRFFQYLPSVLKSLTEDDTTSMNGKMLSLDLGTYGKAFNVSSLFAAGKNFTADSVSLPVNDDPGINWETAGDRPCLTNSLRKAFNRFDYNESTFWDEAEWKEYSEAYQERYLLHLVIPITYDQFLLLIFQTFAGAEMDQAEYYQFMRYYGVIHSFEHIFLQLNNAPARTATTKTMSLSDFKNRGNEPESACSAFRPGDFVAVAPTNNADDREVLLITEISVGAQLPSVSYNLYRGQLHDNKVRDHQVSYSVFALYEHGGNGGVLRESTTRGHLMQSVAEVKWQVNGKNLQEDGTTLTLKDMALNGTFVLEDMLSDYRARRLDSDCCWCHDSRRLEAHCCVRVWFAGQEHWARKCLPWCANQPYFCHPCSSCTSTSLWREPDVDCLQQFYGTIIAGGDGVYVHISGAGAENFGYSGERKEADTSITVNVMLALQAGKHYVFTFKVTNPMDNQTGANISVHIKGVIQSVIMPFNNAHPTCGCDAGAYKFEAEDGYGGTGFELHLTIDSLGITGTTLVSGGHGYVSAPPLKITKYAGTRALLTRSQFTTYSNKYTCVKCSAVCGLTEFTPLLRATYRRH